MDRYGKIWIFFLTYVQEYNIQKNLKKNLLNKQNLNNLMNISENGPEKLPHANVV